jgi:hypothetical protein
MKQPVAALSSLFEPSYVDIPIRDQRDTMERPFLAAKSRVKPPLNTKSQEQSLRFIQSGIRDRYHLGCGHSGLGCDPSDRGTRQRRSQTKNSFSSYQLLRGIRRNTGGDQYKKLQEALRRLASTYVETNIRVPKGSRKKQPASIGWKTGMPTRMKTANRLVCL